MRQPRRFAEDARPGRAHGRQAAKDVGGFRQHGHGDGHGCGRVVDASDGFARSHSRAAARGGCMRCN